MSRRWQPSQQGHPSRLQARSSGFRLWPCRRNWGVLMLMTQSKCHIAEWRLQRVWSLCTYRTLFLRFSEHLGSTFQLTEIDGRIRLFRSLLPRPKRWACRLTSLCFSCWHCWPMCRNLEQLLPSASGCQSRWFGLFSCACAASAFHTAVRSDWPDLTPLIAATARARSMPDVEMELESDFVAVWIWPCSGLGDGCL